jgi:hypothetical protein
MHGTIITFYSYAGGVGRTMTVANAAWILASSGHRVLAVDWDLESPGLHRYFRPFLSDPELAKSRGLVDFLGEFSNRKKDMSWLDKCTLPVNCQLGTGSISLIPAGRQDEDYAERVDDVSRKNARELFGGFNGIADFRDRLSADYDYVLIDGPTGVGESVEICNAKIPDVLVALFTLNHKNIAGTVAEAEKAFSERRGSLQIFPVPSRIEYGESEKLRAAMDHARQLFAPLIAEIQIDPDNKYSRSQAAYWHDVEIPYVSYYAFEEIPPVLRDEPGSSRGLTGSHERLLSWIIGQTVTFELPSEFLRRELIQAYGFGGETKAIAGQPLNRMPFPTRQLPVRRWLWRWFWPLPPAVVVLAPLLPLLVLGLLGWFWLRGDADKRISAMIDELPKIEQTSVQNGIELPKGEVNRALTSLRAIRDALHAPPTPKASAGAR